MSAKRTIMRAAEMLAIVHAQGRRVVSWEVSSDVDEELRRFAEDALGRLRIVNNGGIVVTGYRPPGARSMLLGYPVEVVPILPPNALVAKAADVAWPDTERRPP